MIPVSPFTLGSGTGGVGSLPETPGSPSPRIAQVRLSLREPAISHSVSNSGNRFCPPNEGLDPRPLSEPLGPLGPLGPLATCHLPLDPPNPTGSRAGTVLPTSQTQPRSTFAQPIKRRRRRPANPSKGDPPYRLRIAEGHSALGSRGDGNPVAGSVSAANRRPSAGGELRLLARSHS